MFVFVFDCVEVCVTLDRTCVIGRPILLDIVCIL